MLTQFYMTRDATATELVTIAQKYYDARVAELDSLMQDEVIKFRSVATRSASQVITLTFAHPAVLPSPT